MWLGANTRPEVLGIYEGSYAHHVPPEITGGGGILQALEAALGQDGQNVGLLAASASARTKLLVKCAPNGSQTISKKEVSWNCVG